MKKNIQNKLLLFFLYFIQGLPYGLQTQFLPIYLHSKTKVNASKILLMKLLSVPWVLKFAWGPFVDFYGTKRIWLCMTNIFLSLVSLMGTFAKPPDLFVLSTVIFFMNLFTSVQDVVVDAAAVSLLNTRDLALGNVAQVVGYKLGCLLSGGMLTSFVGFVGWVAMFFAISLLYVCAAVISLSSTTLLLCGKQELVQDEVSVNSKKNHLTHGHVCETSQLILSKDSRECSSKKCSTRKLLHDVFSESSTVWMLSFLFTYKLGEQGALSALPLFLLHAGVPLSDVNFWLGIVGQTLSIFGSILGVIIIRCASGSLSSKDLLQHSCLLRLIPAASQFLVVMLWNHEFVSKEVLLYALVFSSQLLLIASGIITTTTFTLMMQVTKSLPGDIQATHHAIMSTTEVLGKLTFVSAAGWIIDSLDYNTAFLIFALLNLIILPLFKKLSQVEMIIDTEKKMT